MKKLVSLALVGASALTLGAGAAAAQPRYDRGDRWVSLEQRQMQLDRRIDRGLRDGSLNRREAWRLRDEMRELVRLENRYRYDGLSRGERIDLDRRYDRLAMQIRMERHDDQYGYGYGYRR